MKEKAFALFALPLKCLCSLPWRWQSRQETWPVVPVLQGSGEPWVHNNSLRYALAKLVSAMRYPTIMWMSERQSNWAGRKQLMWGGIEGSYQQLC